MLNAVAKVWPETKVYSCAYHLMWNVETILKEGGLYDRRRRIVKTLNKRTFIDPGEYALFRQVANQYLSADLSKTTTKQQAALVKLGRWLETNEDAIVRSLIEKHWPVTSGAIERPLREIKNTIYDRRANLKNLDRVQHLLTLAQLRQMGCADECEWALVLRTNHLSHHGTPPPRREVDKSTLRAG